VRAWILNDPHISKGKIFARQSTILRHVIRHVNPQKNCRSLQIIALPCVEDCQQEMNSHANNRLLGDLQLNSLAAKVLLHFK
jgi:hypothetical protein